MNLSSELGIWGNIFQILGVILPIIGGLLGFFNRLTRKIDRLEQNFKPNGGASLRDAIDRIDKKVDRIDRDVANLSGRFMQHIKENDE